MRRQTDKGTDKCVGVRQPQPDARHDVTMLAVDDEPDILEGFAMLLEENLGVHVVTAPSGAEGLRILARTPVDLVISDYRMPGMDGCAFLESAHRMAPQVPMVMVTAYPDEELERRAFKIGVSGFLSKALDPEDLVEEIRHALQAGTQPARAGAPADLPGPPRRPRSAGEEDREGGAQGRPGALAPDAAPVQLHDALADVEAQARPWLDLV